MRPYAQDRFNNNVGMGAFDREGPFEIPKLTPERFEPVAFVPFSEANRVRSGREKTGLHFFMDDYRFDCVWNFLARYAEMFRQFGAVLTPDWSMYADWPVAMQIWNHYRKHFVGALLQREGVKVYPTVCWSDERSLDWCFDGEPVGGTVAVSSVGAMKYPEARRMFLRGYAAMMERLKPETVIFYGDVPEECGGGNVVRLTPFGSRFDAARKNTQRTDAE